MEQNKTTRSILLQLELKLLDNQFRKDSDEAAKLLRDEFIEYGSSGRIYNKEQALAAMKKDLSGRFSITNFDIAELSKDVVLVMYRLTQYDEHMKQENYSLRSSVWIFEKWWKILFHQGTKVY